ncbi:THO complex subunit 5 homolog [Penaeus vannamei]|uniref:THO complex subunit 5 homolog n=1 Tax=Penaeus vannamei TaxID=6689 RepID=UPI000F6751B2|nr:THO complex subunit 5 homolog [Penaeus vannamei]
MGRGDKESEASTRESKRRRKTAAEGSISLALTSEMPKKTVASSGSEGDGPEAQTALRTTKEKDSLKTIADTYQASLEHECQEARQRTEEEDQETVAKIIQHIRFLMKEILKLKTEKPDQWSSEVEERRVQVLMLILSLRRLSRVQKVRVRDARDKTAEARQSVDGVTLQLQNLLYEVAHLKKEVRRCLEFQSADQEIDLVPVEQFYIEAPESISRPTETVDKPHEQRLARLQWELEQRRGQTQLFDKLTQEKESVADMISEQERKLASLAPRINSILEATRPLQEALDLPLDAKREQQRIVQLLPSPLYTLWVQASAYGEAFDPNIKVEVNGDVEAAKKLITKEEDARTENFSDSENDQDQQEENLSRKKRTRKSQKMDTDDVDDGVKQILALHPLSVKICVNTKDGNSVVITFYHMQVLRIVTVKCSVHLQEKNKSVLSDVISGDTLLNCLFPNDDGEESPNPANFFQLVRLQIQLKDHLASTGRPYKWAQNLSGLSFSTSEQTTSDDGQDKAGGSAVTTIPPVENEVVVWQDSAEHMQNTIQAIRRRLQARLALHAQLVNLETANSTSSIAVPAELLRQHFPGKVCTEFKSWRSVTWSEYKAAPTTQLLRESGVVTQQHLLFIAVFERKHVRLEALVAIFPDHPNTVPVFSLSVHWEGHHQAANNPQLRQMEKEVNVHWDELVTTRNEQLHLLPLLLYRLAVCLDVFTEAYSAHADAHKPDSQFHKEKIFFRPARGPDRAFPFKYHPKLGVFSQR